MPSSDSGFPPFRSAPPKGQAPVLTEAQLRRAQESEPTQAEKLQAVKNVLENVHPPERKDGERAYGAEEEVEHITVCAKCGSREVREAVLIGDEVYVKLGE